MSKKSKSKKRKQRRILRIILVILIILLALTAGVVGAGIYLLGNLNTVDLDASDEDLGVSGESVKGITNIALYGVDKLIEEKKKEH